GLSLTTFTSAAHNIFCRYVRSDELWTRAAPQNNDDHGRRDRTTNVRTKRARIVTNSCCFQLKIVGITSPILQWRMNITTLCHISVISREGELSNLIQTGLLLPNCSVSNSS